MSEVNREAVKAAMIEMIANKEGLGQSGAPNVAPLEEKLDLVGQIGAPLRNELMAEIEDETKSDSSTTPPAETKSDQKLPVSKAEKSEETEKVPAKTDPTRTSNLTLRDGVPHRVYFENGRQVKVEKVKLQG